MLKFSVTGKEYCVLMIVFNPQVFLLLSKIE